MAYTNIDLPTDYFNTKLYTGTGATNSLNGVGFQPDWVWIKKRNPDDSHSLYDVVRGTTKSLRTNGTDAEQTRATTLTSFDADGFTLSTNNEVNASGATFVSWNWKANGAGVSNTSGSITSTVSANTTSGFSVVSYTGNGTSGANIGHGLGKTPAMIICKDRSAGEEWSVYHQSLTYTKYLVLESTAGAVTNSRFYQAPTSSLFYVSDSYGVNKNADNYIAYCFAEVKGFSKFGSYTGNGSTDGTFIYTGFSPAFVMIKETSGVGAWRIYDSKRGQGGDNIGGNYKNALMANVSDVEESGATNNIIDSLSNGFKCRYSFDDTNGSGGSYIYMAFANSPFVSSKGIPTTAR